MLGGEIGDAYASENRVLQCEKVIIN